VVYLILWIEGYVRLAKITASAISGYPKIGGIVISLRVYAGGAPC
jgi:hypothetical protein